MGDGDIFTAPLHCAELSVNTKYDLNGISKNSNLYGKDSYLRFLIIVYMKKSKNTVLCFLLRQNL